MLLKADLLAEIKAGKIDTVFRRWKRATVKPGGTLMTSAGLLSIDTMEPIALDDVKLADVQRAGFASLADFRAWLDTMKEGDLCIIRLHYAGEDPRVAMRQNGNLSPAELGEIDAQLAKLDVRGPWTDKVLRLIGQYPGRLAEELAGEFGLERAPFKARVVKLKELGLTESLDVGYRLSARGERVVRHRDG
ncbi:MAG: hypothetical protein JWN11_1949 [Hyphomicrobiales bacterium]|nr:hypothetical protein [Hyphomicrobiales bacterium]